MSATKRKPAKKKPSKASKAEARPLVDPGLSIAARFDLPGDDDGYFDRSVEWDGGYRDEWEDFD